MNTKELSMHHLTQLQHVPTRTDMMEKTPTIQYASGRVEARMAPNQPFNNHIGLYAEVGTDDLFDEAMEDAGFGQIDIRHQKEGEAPTVCRSWHLGVKLGIWPLSTNPGASTASASSFSPYAERTANAGIALRWETKRNGQRQSRLAIRGYLYQLVRIGHVVPIQLSVSSRMSDTLLAAMQDHLAVCEQAEEVMEKRDWVAQEVDAPTLEYLCTHGQADTVAFYDLLLPLSAGPEEQFRGKQGTSTVRPLISAHPDPVTAAYVKKIWRPLAVLDAVGRDWADTVAWAHRYAHGARVPNDHHP
jgi:hypothetical protein